MRTVSTRILICLMLLVPLAMTAASPSTQGRSRRVIEFTAERFEFWPPEVTLAAGEEVEIRITSDDTSHGFRIVGTGTNLIVPKRGQGQAVALFRPPAPGRYTFECSRMCGAGHNFMRGALIVRAPGGESR
jgi:heme/copper-type cytochrome/quinol oxidase subunit 2